MGKGSNKRPMDVSLDKFRKNYDRIFKRDKQLRNKDEGTKRQSKG